MELKNDNHIGDNVAASNLNKVDEFFCENC
jgi:hypothetical protein